MYRTTDVYNFYLLHLGLILSIGGGNYLVALPTNLDYLQLCNLFVV